MASHSVNYDTESGFILVEYIGEADREDVEAVRSEVIELTKQHHCLKVLVDVRKAKFKMEVSEIFNIPKATEKVLSEQNLSQSLFKRAFLVAENSQEWSFFENVAVNRGHNVKLFFDMGEAKTWILDG